MLQTLQHVADISILPCTVRLHAADAGIKQAMWGNLLTASKGVWLGSGLLGEVNPAYQEQHAKETADAIIQSCVEGTKAIIVVSETQVGAIDSKNRLQTLVKDDTAHINRVLTFADRGFVAYTTKNALLNFRHVHVFSLKRPNECANLAATLEDVAPVNTETEDEWSEARSGNGGSEESNVVRTPSVSGPGMKVLTARHLGSAMVSDRGWWERNDALLSAFGASDQKTTDQLFDAAALVLCQKLEGRHDVEPTGLLRDNVGVVVSSENIKVVDALTQETLVMFMPISITEVRVIDLPMATRRNSVVPGSPGKHVLPVNTRMTEAQRMDFMTKVRDGGLGVDDAVEQAIEAEQIEEKLVCIGREDAQLAAIHIDILLCSSGPKHAENMRLALEAVVDQAIKRRDDPFCPKTDDMDDSPTEYLAQFELDRDKLMAVELVGHGEFGEVFLANQSIPVADLAKDDPARNNAEVENGEVEVQRAVKTVGPKVGKQGISEFTAEAAIQLKLKHKHIADLVGVCMKQKPYLVVLEYIMYGDLKKVLTTCREKEIMIRPAEMFYFCEQIVDALAYISEQRIVHLDLASRNCLIHAKSNLKIADFGLARNYDPPKKKKSKSSIDGGDPGSPKKKSPRKSMVNAAIEGFHLVGKMKIPFLWCPPECLPRSMWDKSIKTYNPVFNEQSDVWAFGVVCWEIATYGVQPYGSSSKLLVLLQEIDNGLRLTWPEGCPSKLKELGERCHALEPENRPRFSDLKDELLEYLEPMKSKIRDVGMLLNAPLEDRLREMSTRATLIRRKSINLLKSGAEDFSTPHKEYRSRLATESDLGTLGEDDEENPFPLDESEDDGAGTPSLEDRPDSVCRMNSIEESNPGSALRSNRPGTLSRRNSFLNASNGDWAVTPDGKARRSSIRNRRRSSRGAGAPSPLSTSMTTVGPEPHPKPRVRTASTHSESVSDDDGAGTPLPDLSPMPIQRKTSDKFYKHSDSEDSDTDPIVHVPATVPEDVGSAGTTPGLTSRDSFDTLGGLLGNFATVADDAPAASPVGAGAGAGTDGEWKEVWKEEASPPRKSVRGGSGKRRTSQRRVSSFAKEEGVAEVEEPKAPGPTGASVALVEEEVAKVEAPNQAAGASPQACNECNAAGPVFVDPEDGGTYCAPCWEKFYGEPPTSDQTIPAAALAVHATAPTPAPAPAATPTPTAAVVAQDSNSSEAYSRQWASRVFQSADINANGNLTKSEIKKYFKANPDDKMSLLGTDFVWHTFFNDMDEDGDGSFDIGEFTHMSITHLNKHSKLLLNVTTAPAATGVPNVLVEEVSETAAVQKKVPPLVAAKKKIPPPVVQKKAPPPVSPRAKKKEMPAPMSAPSPPIIVLEEESVPRGESSTEDDLAFLMADLEESALSPKKEAEGGSPGSSSMLTPNVGMDPERDGRESVRKRRDKRKDRLQNMNWDINEDDEA
jgi:serine/threonine protein kinase